MAEHVPVLLEECIEMLNIRPDGIYLDGTLGLGGHSAAIAARLTTGLLIGIDRDETAIQRAGERLKPFGERVKLVLLRAHLLVSLVSVALKSQLLSQHKALLKWLLRLLWSTVLRLLKFMLKDRVQVVKLLSAHCSQ